MRVTHTSSVTEDQIDHLGHMNVRYYAANARVGTDHLLADLESWQGRRFLVHDLYTRHHREQLLGTPLVVRSAVLGASADALRVHHELAAADSGELAATFVHGLSPVDADGRQLPVPDAVVAEATTLAVPQPDYAASRTISLDADLMAAAPTLDTVVDRGLAMRRERTIQPDECDESGAYRLEMAPMLTWGGEPLDGELGPHLHETSEGQLMAWASMETRVLFGTLPTVGTRMQSFGAGIAIHDKVTHRVHWSFDLDTGALLTAFEAVSLAFDTRSRRPMSIPDALRRHELDRLQPDLAPQALA